MVLLQVHQRLIEETKHVAGAKVENNKFCVSVHFRCVDEKVGDGRNRTEMGAATANGSRFPSHL